MDIKKEIKEFEKSLKDSQKNISVKLDKQLNQKGLSELVAIRETELKKNSLKK